MKIYKSRKHLAVTLLVVIAPFLFLLLFSKAEKIPTGQLFLDVFFSFLRLLIAYVIAAALAWLFAVSFYKGRRANVALPLFDVLQSFPTFAALPLATYLWGTSQATVIIFLVVTIIWPIFFSVVSSLKLIKHDWEEAVEIAGLKGPLYLKKYLWPITVPGLITGSIIGLGEGWEALVATEIIINLKNGLGDFFQTYSRNTQITLFGILGFLILIFCVNKLLWLPLLELSHKKMEE
ncbi:MAG TPA: ABC transporter permease subunit [Patescibacteria group bacterium]|jgi:ABC-type nitrate/sulfonate/bicarbonate transport system permease component|nr:ABC transporter permease subunit [Patescibacteria group bacterium]